MTRSRLLGPGLGVLTAALVVSASPPVSAEPVAGAATYTVTGYGYGHGHGMSQYGAQGAANQGLTWKQIVGFYYPGTRLGRAHGPLKVLITADKRDVVVDARAGLRLTRLAGRKTFRLDKVRPRATRWQLLPKGSKSVISYRAPGRGGWTKWTAFPGSAQFSAGNKPLTLRLPHQEAVSYRGALRSVERHTVNVLSLDSYVRGVVPREVPAEWPAEAVRAQSVAARTYAAFERANATSYYDICDTESCQVYGGVDDEHPASDAAVRATRGRILTYQGEPAFTQFSSSNGGYSTAGSQPYLVAQADPYEASSDNPNDPWTATLTQARIEKTWPEVGTLANMVFTRDGLGPHFGGRVTSVTLSGTQGQVVKVSGDDFRFRLGLKSTWLQLTPA
ncbi:MAG TPA: SpoIID/LytB domain-containing protein [Nocardioides sp.]|uniref:SpoIID/LytB domain-containing protein n=1 Tax=uncultured Nocardioides sp. TaxID=198441 RepID=UPI0026127DED|nr:SpoIID/LytB domain-containing protein [uncultured Nocardioides sp.]HRD63313.1 SpoIID/LytB domain-containing protein [Nocardioides sp.]HRI98781.1 SpoIID/LytB domain-containing protein [Nocardioides sp.]HRK47566.1 SpoIID/LytB domain-containing protein [Nocardioides sp.]